MALPAAPLPSGVKSNPYLRSITRVNRATGPLIRIPSPLEYPMTRVLLTANATIVLPTPVVGMRLDLALEQTGSAGKFTVTYSPTVSIAWANNIAPVLSTTSTRVDYHTFYCTTEGVWDGFANRTDDSGTFQLFSLGDGAVTAATTYQQRFRTFSRSIEILGVSATTGFGFGPSTTDLVLDLVSGSGGTSLWPTNPSSRPTIAAGSEEVLAETVPDTTIIDAFTSIRAKCVTAGTSPNFGSYVVLAMRYRWVG